MRRWSTRRVARSRRSAPVVSSPHRCAMPAAHWLRRLRGRSIECRHRKCHGEADRKWTRRPTASRSPDGIRCWARRTLRRRATSSRRRRTSIDSTPAPGQASPRHGRRRRSTGSFRSTMALSGREQAARRCTLAIDSLEGSAWANLGILEALRARDLSAGEPYFRRAIAAEPANAEIFMVYGAALRFSAGSVGPGRRPVPDCTPTLIRCRPITWAVRPMLRFARIARKKHCDSSGFRSISIREIVKDWLASQWRWPDCIAGTRPSRRSECSHVPARRHLAGAQRGNGARRAGLLVRETPGRERTARTQIGGRINTMDRTVTHRRCRNRRRQYRSRARTAGE